LWDLAASFPDRDTINRGFGGSELEDSLHFADRIVIPHQPKVIFLYAGDNDIQGGKSAARVVDDYRKFVAKIHAALPQTGIVFLPIKPSLSRWEKWPEMKKANEAILGLSKKNPLLHSLDTAAPMLGQAGRPKPGLFQKDGLHLNRKGYAVWTEVVSDWLKANARAAASPAGE
jgi:lysophospholipase L1-like esterase